MNLCFVQDLRISKRQRVSVATVGMMLAKITLEENPKAMKPGSCNHDVTASKHTNVFATKKRARESTSQFIGSCLWPTQDPDNNSNNNVFTGHRNKILRSIITGESGKRLSPNTDIQTFTVNSNCVTTDEVIPDEDSCPFKSLREDNTCRLKIRENSNNNKSASVTADTDISDAHTIVNTNITSKEDQTCNKGNKGEEAENTTDQDTSSSVTEYDNTNPDDVEATNKKGCESSENEQTDDPAAQASEVNTIIVSCDESTDDGSVERNSSKRGVDDTTATDDSTEGHQTNKRVRKLKRGLKLCSNITCYIEQVLYNC